MLTITIPELEGWDNVNQEFVILKPSRTIQLEHSLVSVSKWEAKWHKPFLSKEPLTAEELLDYVRCMTVTSNVDPELYSRLSRENYKAIQSYMDDPMTATWFGKKGAKQSPTKGLGGGKAVTSEVIYYWMISYNIPVEFQKWHLSRLMTLIKVFNEENKPKDKRNRVNQRDAAAERARLNAERRAAMHTTG